MKYHIELIGRRIREERQKREITIEKLAEMIEVSDSHLGLVERGVRGVSVEVLIRIASLFNISVDSLLCEDATPTDVDRVESLRAYIENLSGEEFDLLKSMAKNIHDFSIKRTN